MDIDIKFDLVNNPEPPTIVLATRSGNKLGQLDINIESIDLSNNFNDASELSFTLNKYVDGKITNLWDKVVDFKLVYCKEWDKWFEIKVELDEATETVKTVFCTQLGQAELSQIMLYNVEINTEADISRDDYKISILYDEDNHDASILHRILSKAPHYSIAHVDKTIAKIQRSFPFDDISICDSLGEIEEEIGCLVVYDSNSDENGMPNRTISVYDLQQNCNSCGHRGEFTDKCPKCGSTDITYGYGEDTTIFVTADELATEGIQLVTDTDSVKNCFKLEAGDDLMTATIRNCNPNGTDYIWYFSDSIKEDMSEELVAKIESYDAEYKHYYNDNVSDLDEDLLNSYNALVEKYNTPSTCLNCDYEGDFSDNCPSCGSESVLIGKRLQTISAPITGYSALMNTYYDTIDFALYLKSGLMPSVEMSGTNAEEQAKLLNALSLTSVGVANIDTVSLATANSAVLAMAKIIVKPTFKVQVNNSELSADKKTWTGSFVVTNYSDEEDTAVSDVIPVYISGDNETFIKQKIEKALNKEDTDDYSISGLFEKEYDEFCEELKKYALNPLISFRDAGQTCMDILIEQGVGNGDSWSDDDQGSESNLYEKLYLPYSNKLAAIESEIKIREDELSIIVGVYDTDGNLTFKGLQTDIEDCKNYIQDILNFENYLGRDLWLEFCAYRREDKYSNDNYISDGLNNAELFKRALEFVEVAEYEIYKSAELQHSISTTLNNLLAIPKFKPLVKSFKTGNWMRVQVDNKIHKLRLINYDISYGDFDNIPVKFSDVIKIKTGVTDVRSAIEQAKSMASSYSSVKKQAGQGEKSNVVLNDWIQNGLNLTKTKIINGYDENLLFDKNGFWCRQYDPITGTYGDEQIKIINSTIAITDDGWDTTKTAIGKFYYVDPITGEEKIGYGVNGETIVGKFILGENIVMQNESGNMVFDGNGLTITSVSEDGVGTMTFDENGLIVNHGDNTVTISPKSEEVMNITNGEDKVFEVNEDGELSINGNIIARSLKLENGVKIDSGVITDLADVATSASYDDLIDAPTKLSEFENDSLFVTEDVNNLKNYYTKTETDELLKHENIIDGLATVALSGSYNDLIDTPTIPTIPTDISSFNNDVGYLTADGLDEAVDNALAEAKESGEFKGEDGVSMEHSWEGTVLTVTSISGTSSADLKGENGYSPVRGTDYWTGDDKTEIINAVLAELRNQGIIN